MYNKEWKLTMNSGTTSTELNDILSNFVEYVDSFYGVNDPLYPLINKENGQPLSKIDIYAATAFYLAQCSDEREELCTWGDGDSLDRERVRDFIINTRATKPQLPVFTS